MKWSKHEVREPKRRHKPIGMRLMVSSERERVSKGKKRPPPGDSITVALANDPGKCAKVTVRPKRSGVPVPSGWFIYSATNAPLLTGTVGMARYADRGVTWAWGWTTPEARALQVAKALGA